MARDEIPAVRLELERRDDDTARERQTRSLAAEANAERPFDEADLHARKIRRPPQDRNFKRVRVPRNYRTESQKSSEASISYGALEWVQRSRSNSRLDYRTKEGGLASLIASPYLKSFNYFPVILYDAALLCWIVGSQHQI